MVSFLSLILLNLACSDTTADVIVESKCCGRYALTLVGRFVNAERLPAAWDRSLPSEKAPFSLRELEGAARDAGLQTLLVQWSDPFAADLRCPCILHIRATEYSAEPDHFIACFGSKGQEVCLGDYPRLPTMIPQKKLCRYWRGAALYVSRPGNIEFDRLRRRIQMTSASWVGAGVLMALVLGSIWWACRKSSRNARGMGVPTDSGRNPV